MLDPVHMRACICGISKYIRGEMSEENEIIDHRDERDGWEFHIFYLKFKWFFNKIWTIFLLLMYKLEMKIVSNS